MVAVVVASQVNTGIIIDKVGAPGGEAPAEAAAIGVEGVVVHGHDEVSRFVILFHLSAFTFHLDGPLLLLAGQQLVAEGGDVDVEALVSEGDVDLLGPLHVDAVADGRQAHMDAAEHRGVDGDGEALDAAAGGEPAAVEFVAVGTREGVEEARALEGGGVAEGDTVAGSGTGGVEVCPEDLDVGNFLLLRHREADIDGVGHIVGPGHDTVEAGRQFLVLDRDSDDILRAVGTQGGGVL